MVGSIQSPMDMTCRRRDLGKIFNSQRLRLDREVLSRENNCNTHKTFVNPITSYQLN